MGIDPLSEVWVAGEVLVDLIPDIRGHLIPNVGGGGANTAKALARLGIATSFIDGISDDELGQLCRNELESSGVNLSRSISSSKPTATAKVMIDSHGSASYQFALDGTATFDFSASWLPQGNPKVLHLGTLATIIEPGCESLYEWASSKDAPKVFDPNIRPSVLGDRAKYRESVERWIEISDVIKLSEDDLFWLYPEAENIDAALEIARIALRKRPQLVVITRGGQGMVGVTNELSIEVPGVPVDVVDTVGAGDTVGAILVEAIYNKDLPELLCDGLEPTLRRAAKAAAITCSRVGAQPPSGAELFL